MAEILKSYDQFDTDELATILNGLANQAAPMLRKRRFNGVYNRYGVSLDTAKAQVEKGQRQTAAGEMGHFAIVKANGDVTGAAALFPKFPLIRTLLPVRARFTRGHLVSEFPHATPNLSAWDVNNDPLLLRQAYRSLREKTDSFIPESGVRNIPWAIEPHASPAHVHDAIIDSGLEKVRTGFFDDGESAVLLPLSTVYAATSDWILSSNRLNELKTGSWIGSYEELMSRNPRD